MNKKILVLVTFLLLAINFYGQRKPDREKIKSLKVAFFTERLNLSSKEAEAFWPVYNIHENKIEEFRKTERREIRSKLRDLESVSEKEAEKLLDMQMELEAGKQLEQQSFIKKMKGILSAKKTILLLKTEEDFKRRLIRQYRQKRKGDGGHR